MAGRKFRIHIIDGVEHISREEVVYRGSSSIFDDDRNFHMGAELDRWNRSEEGLWVAAHSLEPFKWEAMQDHATLMINYIIVARMTETNHTYYQLRFK